MLSIRSQEIAVMSYQEFMTSKSRTRIGSWHPHLSFSQCKPVRTWMPRWLSRVINQLDPSGFGMLESGCVSVKNEVNIMMKNIIDVVLGGFTYWLFGYGMSFGRGSLSNPFIALGDFLIDPGVDDPLMGQIFAAFLFQLSFSTTATTIVSGAMAERCNFKAYCLFSLLNTLM